MKAPEELRVVGPEVAAEMAPMHGLPTEISEYPQEEGIFIPDQVVTQVVSEKARLKELDVRSRAEKNGLGSVALVGEISEIDPQCEPIRHHQLFTIEVNGYKNALWVTEPTKSKDGWPEFNLFHHPGLGENIESGVGFEMHASLAREFPEAQIITVANNGMGRESGKFSPAEAKKFTLDAMAEQRHEIIKALDGTVPNVLVGTSLGTIINNKILILDLENGGVLNVVKVIHYDPALVPFKKVPVDLGLLFVPGMVKDVGTEILFRTPPQKILGVLAVCFASFKERPSNFAAMGIQAVGVLRGTRVRDIKRTLDHYETSVIAAEKDPAAQIKMWEKLIADQLRAGKSSLSLETIKKRGHGMAINPVRAAYKVAKTIRANRP